MTEEEKDLIQKYFGRTPEELDAEHVKRTLQELRTKYHPDNFEKYEDAAVREMATERFQQIEALALKIERYLSDGRQKTLAPEPEFMNRYAVFSANELKIEIVTTDKDLKYRLFGTSYRWLQSGQHFKIPNTKAAYIIIDDDHSGTRIGYQESIRMYLTFDKQDPVETIIEWLLPRIYDAKYLLIAGEKVAINRESMAFLLRKQAFLGLERPPAEM